MGLLDRFRKEEYYNKETGRFEPVRHETRELTYEEQFPERKPSRWQQASERRREERKVYREEYQKAKMQGLRQRAERQGRQAGSTSWMDRIAGPPPSRRQRTTYYTPKTRKKKTRRQYQPPYRIQNNYNPFGTTFDTGIGKGFDMIDNYGFFKSPRPKKRKRRR